MAIAWTKFLYIKYLKRCLNSWTLRMESKHMRFECYGAFIIIYRTNKQNITSGYPFHSVTLVFLLLSTWNIRPVITTTTEYMCTNKTLMLYTKIFKFNVRNSLAVHCILNQLIFEIYSNIKITIKSKSVQQFTLIWKLLKN